MAGGILQIGLPEKRISPTATIPVGRFRQTINEIMEAAQRRMEGSQLSGSTWVFHSFVAIEIRVATNTALNSGVAYNRLGGKGHGNEAAESFIITEAEEDGGGGAIADVEDEEEETGQDLDYR